MIRSNTAKRNASHIVPAILTLAIWSTYSMTRLNNLLIGALGVYFIIVGWPYVRFQWKRDLTLLLPAFLFLAYFVGLLWSSDLNEGWHQLEKRLGFLAFPLIFFFGRNFLTPSDVTKILYAFVIACFGVSLVCYGGAIWNVIEHHSFIVVTRATERTYYYFSYLPFVQIANTEPIYLSLFVNFCILVFLFRPLRMKWLNIAAILYAVVFNVLVSSKAGLVVTLIIFIMYAFSFILNKTVAMGLSMLLAIGCFLAVYHIAFLRERFLVSAKFDYESAYAGEWNSTSQRLAIWSCAIESILKHPFSGYGTGDGQLALNETYSEKKYVRGYEDEYNAHSEYLFTWLDLGLIGLGVLSCLIVYPLVLAYKRGDNLFLFLLIMCSIYFLVEVVLTRRFGINFFSFFYSLLAVNDFICRNKDISHEV